MDEKKKPSKDWWDRVEIIGKIISGIVLVIIAIVLDRGSDKIATSLKSGQLVQSLITDLSSPDSTVRQEIALIALDQSLWEQNPELVWQVCEQIVQNTRDYNQAIGGVAFQVLLARDSSRAKEFRKSLISEIGRQTSTSSAADSISKDTSVVIADSTSRIGYRDLQTIRLLTRVQKNKVYVHFNKETHRDIAKKLQTQMREAGFYAPGVQRVESNYKNNIRYFHEEDLVLAEIVKQLTLDFLNNEKYTLKGIPILNFSNTEWKDKAPIGLVEIWLNLDKMQN